MKVLHISAECYPAAKAGGLGDVVGSLPKYLNKAGWPAGVVIPKYRSKWMEENKFSPIFKGAIRIHNYYIPYIIEKEIGDALGFPLFVVDIPGKFDRSGIYNDASGRGYEDNVERYIAFQMAVLQWISGSPGTPSILHCHDHHSGLIPFFIKHCPDFKSLGKIPTVFTIHNGEYHGSFGWQNLYLLPWFEQGARGILDWNNAINPLATAIKTAWRFTTVSKSYLEELKEWSNGLEWLIQHEQYKSVGILNGIDTQVWDPATDSYLIHHLKGDPTSFKNKNKQVLSRRFVFDSRLPVIAFIGRLVREKGADLLPDLISKVLDNRTKVVFLILGTGEEALMDRLWSMKRYYPDRLDLALEYNEELAHQLYAGSDFLLMPSRVEPCGLNQMYAMRYGTIPIVRSVGGLKDTVVDIDRDPENGSGIRFDDFNLEDGQRAISRAAVLYAKQKTQFEHLRNRIMALDYSWEESAANYIQIYKQFFS